MVILGANRGLSIGWALMVIVFTAETIGFSAEPEWRDQTARDQLTSALNKTMGNVIARDFNGDGAQDLLFISSDLEPRLFFREPASGVFSLVTRQQLPDAVGTTQPFRLGLAEDIDADGKADLLLLSYFSFNPTPDAYRPPGVQLYLTSAAGIPERGRIWRSPDDEGHLDRLIASLFASRQGFDGRVPSPEEVELNSEPEPATDPIVGQNPLVRHSAPFGHSDKGVWADLDGDGMNELVLVRKEMRALIYAAPSFDGEVVRFNTADRTVTIQQTVESTAERDLGDLSNANGTVARGVSRSFKIKARTVDFPVGSEVRIRGANGMMRGTVRAVSSDVAGNLGLSKGRLLVEVSVGAREPYLNSGRFRVNRLKRYTQVLAFGEEETLVAGNNSRNRRPMGAQRAAVQVVDLNRDGRQEVVIVDQSVVCEPIREGEGNLVSVENRLGCYGNQSDGNARLHVLGYQASGDGAGRVVDWMNLPVADGLAPSFEASLSIPSPSSQAGTGVAFSDLNGDGVLDLIVSAGARNAGERRCLLFVGEGRDLNAPGAFEEEVRWGCPFIAAQGRVDSADRRLNVAGRMPAALPDLFRTRVYYGNVEGGRLRFRAGDLGFQGVDGAFENFERILSVGHRSTEGGADPLGPRVVLLRAPGSGRRLPSFDVAAVSAAAGGGFRVLRECRNLLNFQYPQLISSVAVRDMNRDGILDLIFYAPTQDFIFYGEKGGCFKPLIQAPITTRWFNRMAKADFNRDGAEDLVVATAGDTELDFAAGLGPRLLFGSGAGLLDRSELLPILPPADTVVAKDLNGDSNPDIFLTGKMIRPTLLLGTRQGFVDVSDSCLPAPLRACVPALVPGGGGNCAAYSISVSDLNGDGKPDLVLTTAKGANRILFNLIRSNTLPAEACSPGLLLSNPDDRIRGMVRLADVRENQPAQWAPPRLLDAAVDLLVPNGNLILRMDVGTNRIKTITAGDFNGDGKPDLFAASGAYSLAERQSVGHELFLNRMVPGSLPRLHEPWINWVSPAAAGSIPVDLRVDSGTTCLQSGDLNGDGVSDLLIARSGNPNPVAWLVNGGSDAELEEADQGGARSALADELPRRLNEAGTGLAYPVTYKVRVLLGQRTNDPAEARLSEVQVPAIQAVIASHPGTRTFDCRIQDVTQDQRPDLILGGYAFGNESYVSSAQRQSGNGWSHSYWMNESKGVQVFRNTGGLGELSFLPEKVVPIRVKNYSVEVLDWSGKGRPDIYLGNASQSRLLIRQPGGR